MNLVNLDGNSESWMLADRVGSTYTYKGETYTIREWFWGPNHEYCNWWLVECQEWIVETGVSTHPTTMSINWNMLSCYKTGCGAGYCDAFIDLNYPYPAFFNQGWIWDPLIGDLSNNTEDSTSCSVP